MNTTIVKSKKTAVKKVASKKTTIAKKVTRVKPVANRMAGGEPKNLAIADIDFSPLNYRKFYSQGALKDFAAELAVHGIINPLTVRRMPSGRYELAAGERRLRAAGIAGLKEVPAMIKALTDEEVTEMQLAENLQREDPHPMHEAYAIGQMKKAKKSIEEIAARLGKSTKFVYSRIRFLDLIEPIQEMFVSDIFNLQEAFDIAALSANSQEEFFSQYCASWKEETNFSISNLRYALSRFKYDLKNAPFNTKDKKLMPEMGACTHCPFNSATLKTLFPEAAEQAICTKKECYQSKCNAHFTLLFTNAFREHEPQALIYEYGITESLQKLFDTIPGMEALPRYGKNQVAIIKAPNLPDKEDFTNAGDGYVNEDFEDEQACNETDEETAFDEAGYNAAFYEYEADLEEYNQLIRSGSLLKGLLVSETKADLIMFSPDVHTNNNSTKSIITAKEVQESIKAGIATPELLQSEIDRINSREVRAKQLDEEKIQLNIHAAFTEAIKNIATIAALTDADLVAARMLVYQSLDWSARNTVDTVLFSEKAVGEDGEKLPFYDVLQNLTHQQYSYLIRAAIGCKSEGKTPNNATGQMIRKVAEGAGVDIALIQSEQHEKATARQSKLTERITDLDKKILSLNHTNR